MTKGHDKTKYFWLWHIYKHTGKCSLSHVETQDSGTLEGEQKSEGHLWAAESVCPDITGRHQPKVLVATAVVPGAIAGEWKCYHRTLFSKTVLPPRSKESTLIRTESAGKKATHPKLHSHFHYRCYSHRAGGMGSHGRGIISGPPTQHLCFLWWFVQRWEHSNSKWFSVEMKYWML